MKWPWKRKKPVEDYPAPTIEITHPNVYRHLAGFPKYDFGIPEVTLHNTETGEPMVFTMPGSLSPSQVSQFDRWGPHKHFYRLEDVYWYLTEKAYHFRCAVCGNVQDRSETVFWTGYRHPYPLWVPPYERLSKKKQPPDRSWVVHQPVSDDPYSKEDYEAARAKTASGRGGEEPW